MSFIGPRKLVAEDDENLRSVNGALESAAEYITKAIPGIMAYLIPA